MCLHRITAPENTQLRSIQKHSEDKWNKGPALN